MNSIKNYGVVYTPNNLSEFVAKVLKDEYYNLENSNIKRLTIIDPACGEASLLDAAYNEMNENSNIELIGVDIDNFAIRNNKSIYNKQKEKKYKFINDDAILGIQNLVSRKRKYKDIGEISMIIANPPWSSEKVYDKQDLENKGYELITGQYDSYVLFIELCMRVLEEGGFGAFILPDSVFSSENWKLREYLSKNYSLKVIARLGEKLFPKVNRATTVLIVQKQQPTQKTLTRCYRLNTLNRKEYLDGRLNLFDIYNKNNHQVKQMRFLQNNNFNFDIDTKDKDEIILRKIESNMIKWNELFRFGRGVEISKTGLVTECSVCGTHQGFSNKQLLNNEKVCIECENNIQVNNNTVSCIVSNDKIMGYKKMYVGENVKRYKLHNYKYIKMNVKGINYKNPNIYLPPKILIRKTGLGINACIDYGSTYISQTVYSCNYKCMDNNGDLEYYLGLLNSRVMFYYYLKQYGENEWKSHPYLTKMVIFSLPLKNKSYVPESLYIEIVNTVKAILQNYSVETDFHLESLVEQVYGISEKEHNIIMKEIDNLPNLSAINHMKSREIRRE